MKKIFAALLVLTAVLPLASCTDKNISSAPEVIMSTQAKDAVGLLVADVTPAAGWERNKNENITYVREIKPGTLFSAIEINAEKIGDGSSFGTYVKEKRAELESLHNTGTFTNTKNSEINGFSATEFTYTSLGRTARMIYIYKENWVYIITCSASETNYLDSSADFGTMLATLTIK